MARPGLEPGTPRFSVVRPMNLNPAELQELPGANGADRASEPSRILRSFPRRYGRRRRPSAFSLAARAPRRRSSIAIAASMIVNASIAPAPARNTPDLEIAIADLDERGVTVVEHRTHGAKDVDFVWRLIAAGWRVAYDPVATVRHAIAYVPTRFGAGGESTPARSVRSFAATLVRCRPCTSSRGAPGSSSFSCCGAPALVRCSRGCASPCCGVDWPAVPRTLRSWPPSCWRSRCSGRRVARATRSAGHGPRS